MSTNSIACNTSAPDLGRNPLRVEKFTDAMGSTFSIILYGNNHCEIEAAIGAAFAELHRLDQMLSNYRADSEWSTVNLNAAHWAVAVSPELFHLLSKCEHYSEQSAGVFDITVGALMKVWGFYKGNGRLPGAEEVVSALARVGYRHVHLDPAQLKVQFDRPGVELDPGGIGKGYAIDRMVDILKQRGFTSALVAGSRSSIYGLGTPPTEPKGWRVRVARTADSRQSATEVFLQDLAISTSAGFEKFFFAEGKMYSHIIDPRTGYPAQGASLVSVLAPRAIDSEAWTKPYFIHGPAWTAKHKPIEFRVFFCNGMGTPS